MAELKPCPFCGGKAAVEKCGANSYFVKCVCGINQDRLYYQRCDAIRAWNERSEPRKTEPLKVDWHYETVCGYPIKDLIIFGELCRSLGISNSELHDFVRNYEIAYDVISKEVQKMLNNTVKKIFTKRRDNDG